MRARLLGVALLVVAQLLNLKAVVGRAVSRPVCWLLGRHTSNLNFRRVGTIQRNGFRPAVVYRCRFCGVGALDDSAPTALQDTARRLLGGRGRS